MMISRQPQIHAPADAGLSAFPPHSTFRNSQYALRLLPNNREPITDNRVRLTSDLRALASGFTLMELMVVMAIIILVAAFATPAFNSLSKSSGRKAAIGNLLGGIEQARSQAMKDGRYTYVVFPAQPVGGARQLPTRRSSISTSITRLLFSKMMQSLRLIKSK